MVHCPFVNLGHGVVHCRRFLKQVFFFRRELAIQIAEQFEALGAGIGVKCAVVSPVL